MGIFRETLYEQPSQNFTPTILIKHRILYDVIYVSGEDCTICSTILTKLNEIESKLHSMASEMNGMEEKIEPLDNKVNALDSQIHNLTTKIESFHANLTSRVEAARIGQFDIMRMVADVKSDISLNKEVNNKALDNVRVNEMRKTYNQTTIHNCGILPSAC